MQHRFPFAALHLTMPPEDVDVNVHPAKTEVKFLSEKAVFDCVHYGVLGALNKQPDRPQVQLKTPPAPVVQPATPQSAAQTAPLKGELQKKQDFFRTMTAEEYKNFSTAVANTPKVSPAAARPVIQTMNAERPAAPAVKQTVLPPVQTFTPPPVPVPVPKSAPKPAPEQITLPIQEELPMPKEIPWRMVGELYRSYILVEQGDEAFLIDKHAAHERINFDRLVAAQTPPMSQSLLRPIAAELTREDSALLLENLELLESLGFACEDFGQVIFPIAAC